METNGGWRAPIYREWLFYGDGSWTSKKTQTLGVSHTQSRRASLTENERWNSMSGNTFRGISWFRVYFVRLNGIDSPRVHFVVCMRSIQPSYRAVFGVFLSFYSLFLSLSRSLHLSCGLGHHGKQRDYCPRSTGEMRMERNNSIIKWK